MIIPDALILILYDDKASFHISSIDSGFVLGDATVSATKRWHKRRLTNGKDGV